MYTERYQSRSVAYYAIQIFKVVFRVGTTVGYPQRVLKNLLSNSAWVYQFHTHCLKSYDPLVLKISFRNQYYSYYMSHIL